MDTIFFFFFRKKRRCIISLPSLFINSAYMFSPRREIGCFELFTDKNFFKTSLVMHKFILLFQKRLLALDSLHTSFPLRISWVNVTKPQFPADLVTFTEEILYGKLLFCVLCDTAIATMHYLILIVIKLFLSFQEFWI